MKTGFFMGTKTVPTSSGSVLGVQNQWVWGLSRAPKLKSKLTQNCRFFRLILTPCEAASPPVTAPKVSPSSLKTRPGFPGKLFKEGISRAWCREMSIPRPICEHWGLTHLMFRLQVFIKTPTTRQLQVMARCAWSFTPLLSRSLQSRSFWFQGQIHCRGNHWTRPFVGKGSLMWLPLQ